MHWVKYIVRWAGDALARVQDDGGGHHGASQRTVPGFVHAGGQARRGPIEQDLFSAQEGFG